MCSNFVHKRAAASHARKSMNVVILTQDAPFFLAENLDYLFSILPAEINVTGCVLFDSSPFEKNHHFLSEVYKTWQIFGTGFLLNYGRKYMANKFNKNKQLLHVLKKHEIPAINLSEGINTPASRARIRSHHPDLLVSIAGNQIFKEELLNVAPKGCLNLHTALLPKYRGLMPTFWVLKNDEDQTGVSVFWVDDGGIDCGPILVQKPIPIKEMTQRELIMKSKKVGMDAVAEAVGKVYEGQYQLIPNDDEKSTYFSFPTKEDVRIFKKRGKRFY